MMARNRRSIRLLVGATAVLLAALLAIRVQTSSAAEGRDGTQPPARTSFKPPALFNFALFKAIFQKHYESPLEELVRMKRFLARAYEAFLSAVKYLYRQARYFLRVCSRSDWSREEIEANLNYGGLFELADELDEVIVVPLAEIEQWLRRPTSQADRNEPAERLAKPAEVEAELSNIERHASEPGYKQLAAELHKLREQPSGARRRAKRTVSGAAEPGPRENFELSQALGRVERGREDYGAGIASNNLHYKPPELPSEMGTEQLELMPGYRHIDSLTTKEHLNQMVDRGLGTANQSRAPGLGSALSKLTSDFIAHFFSSGEQQGGPDSEAATEGDEVWVDHRRGGCLMPVQDQGSCNACYAFGTIALLEWALCQEMGERVKLSEQYVVDCGTRLEKLNGCNGGPAPEVARFVQNFGLELARHYHYRDQQQACPYNQSTPLDEMGYLRVSLPTVSFVPLSSLEFYLDKWPMVVNIDWMGAGTNFAFYGGGVFEADTCEGLGTHTLVLIGHGREDGQEYWLLRDSLGLQHGEKGHLKLNKKSDCIYPRFGLVLGDVRRRRTRLLVERNPKVPDKEAAEHQHIQDEREAREAKWSEHRFLMLISP